ncbi:hypothetical protein HID58_026900 [Brassica napus]|uniref:Dolichyl-diphosphooligosaccharide--protein glycosyltransferase subunit 1 n=1 Tax=Brassica napus TaxID=3708 RepID=A0ABQ8CSA7_BRANA|nr:hypothetical protein HID58_026900 [Brassica napus]
MVPQYSYAPIVFAFAVGERLVREIEVSHWGNVEVTEHYNLVHRGAQLKGEFSRFEYQDRPNPQGAFTCQITTPFAVKQSHELFVLFITCIIYTRADFSISKSSAAYLAKLQWDELEASLRDLSRTGDIQTCKASRKSTDSLLKDLSKELRPFLASLQSLPSASQISPKVEELVSKEKELQEKLMAKHTTVVEGYEKK